MKIHIPLLLALCISTAISCKKDTAAEEAEVTEAVEAAPVTNEAKSYRVDAQASQIEWAGSKPTGKHTGTIALSEGEIFVKDTVLASGKFTIDMKSITVTDLKAGDGKEDLEAHLKGLKEGSADHFFNTTKFPTATFEITGLAKEGDKTMIEGNLTIKGIAKNIKFPATINITENLVLIDSETFKIDRTLWNVNYNSKNVFENLGNDYINDDIELKISIKAIANNAL
ncbi:MAG TPA: YceI family protein [Flavobacterium sp.]|nr:YceI family protein [Flavobacterium sp.]